MLWLQIIVQNILNKFIFIYIAVTLSAISQIITGIGIPCAQLPFAMVRRRIRIIRGIKGSLPMDCLCSAFCFCCVMVQAKREINVNDDDDCCAI